MSAVAWEPADLGHGLPAAPRRPQLVVIPGGAGEGAAAGGGLRLTARGRLVLLAVAAVLVAVVLGVRGSGRCRCGRARPHGHRAGRSDAVRDRRGRAARPLGRRRHRRHPARQPAEHGPGPRRPGARHPARLTPAPRRPVSRREPHPSESLDPALDAGGRRLPCRRGDALRAVLTPLASHPSPALGRTAEGRSTDLPVSGGRAAGTPRGGCRPGAWRRTLPAMYPRRRAVHRHSHHPFVHCGGQGRWLWSCGCGARGIAAAGGWHGAFTAALVHQSLSPGE